MKTKPIQTYTAGATAERTAILAHVRRLAKAEVNGLGHINACNLIDWLLSRNERYQKRKGGVGK